MLLYSILIYTTYDFFVTTYLQPLSGGKKIEDKVRQIQFKENNFWHVTAVSCSQVLVVKLSIECVKCIVVLMQVAFLACVLNTTVHLPAVQYQALQGYCLTPKFCKFQYFGMKLCMFMYCSFCNKTLLKCTLYLFFILWFFLPIKFNFDTCQGHSV